MKIILASNSPRRKELLSGLDLKFEICAAKQPEKISDTETPKENVLRVAKAKALEVFENNPDALVLGADTIVVLDNVIYGKPQDALDAFRMLKNLSGKTHQVLTGVYLICSNWEYGYVEESNVTFRELTEEEIGQYIQTKEPLDKAGAYAIQGKGYDFISEYDGELENIVGLPLIKLQEILQKRKIIK